MAEATISSDRWVRDADLEEQKEQQTRKVLPCPVFFALREATVFSGTASFYAVTLLGFKVKDCMSA